MKTRQTLSVDLDALFPGTSVLIGNQSIIIRPLNIEQLSILSKQVTGMGTILAEKNITWENFNTTENIVQLTAIVLNNIPQVLEECANVDIEDLKQLPIELIAKIIEAIITENLKSKDALEKNFRSLTGRFRPEIVKAGQN